MHVYILLLKKTIGWPAWDITTPIMTPKASVLIINVFVKSSKANIGMWVILFFNYVKAKLPSILQENLIEHNKSERGVARVT